MIELGYPRRGLHGHVVDELGRHIVSGRWAPGEPLPNEDDLVAELGVSRTVVRESIKVLQAKGLVEVRRNRDARPATADVAPPRCRCRRLAVRRPRARRRARRPPRAARSALDDRGGGGSLGGRTADRRAAGRDRGQRTTRRGGVGRAARPSCCRPRLPRRGRRGGAQQSAGACRCDDQGGPRAAGSPSNGEAEAARRAATLRADVARAIRAGDAQASEAAMRALVELDWTSLLEGHS